MRYLLVFVMAVMLSLSACGSSSGGGGVSPDLSCAPDSPLASTVDIDGSWTLRLTRTGTSTCPAPVSTITCDLTMTEGDAGVVAVTGTCVADGTAASGTLTAIISGNILYWGATMSATVGTYSEIDTIDCTSVVFTDTESATFSIDVDVSWTDAGDTGTCTSEYNGQFT